MRKSTTPVAPGPQDQDGRRCTVAFAVRHPLVRAGAVWATAAEHLFRVVEAVDAVEALNSAVPADLTVVEVDPSRPPCVRQISALADVSTVVLLASRDDRVTRELAVETGVESVVDHDTEIADLVAALRQLAENHTAYREPPDQRPSLSRREIETMGHIGEGLTYRQIARRMGLSEATVGTYARRIRHKLNAATKIEMVMNAMESGYVLRPGVRARSGVLVGSQFQS